MQRRWGATSLLLLFVTACGSDDDGGSDPGGSGGSGGSTAGSAGMAGSGGSAGSGGASGSAGAAGSAGVAGSGSVDASTLTGKHMLGYQGWFLCPGDGSPPNRWVHWFTSQTPTADNLGVEMWPDVSELSESELFDTQMTYDNGQPARLFSAFVEPTVVRHFAWMQTAGIDGVFLQRFMSELDDPKFLGYRDQVADNVRVGAEQHGRVFALMYDITSADPTTLVDVLKQDWAHLVNDSQLTQSPRYLRHNGKPVLAIWGLGFSDRPGTVQQATAIIDWFRSGAPADQQVTLMGGVPTRWRTLGTDSKTDPGWANVYRSFDVVSPWSVGRYADEAGADNFQTSVTEPDLAEAATHGFEYMPVVFPGFSWNNLNAGPLNQIPRMGGAFYWRQVYNGVSAGSSMLYTAMFDEVDEGTAMFKVAATAADAPTQGTFLTLDADGQNLPSDWYLRLAGEASRMVRGDIQPTPDIPIQP